MKRAREDRGNRVAVAPSGFDAELEKALETLNVLEAAQEPSKAPKRKPTSREATAKKARVAPLERVPSFLEARPHELPAMAKVTFRPSIETNTVPSEGAALVGTASPTIVRLVISPGHRTPSPFGGPMGDHTVAWQAVVDSVRALVHGLTFEKALTALQKRQEEVSEWMAERDSLGRKLLLLLDDKIRRAERLEDAAFQVKEQLKAAKDLMAEADWDAAEVRKCLEQAIAYHLTYVNYLPFATVRSTSSRGAKGSGEGAARKVVLNVEAPTTTVDAEAVGADLEEDLTAEESQATDLGEGDASEEDDSEEEEEEEEEERAAVHSATAVREALWKLFSFDAALRAARANVALVKGAGPAVVSQHERLEDLAENIIDQLNYNFPGKGKSRDPKADFALVEKYQKETKDLHKALYNDPQKDRLYALAGHLNDATVKILETRLTGRPGAAGTRDKIIEKIGKVRTPAQTSRDTLVNQAATARPDAAMVLAHLLHDHQTTVTRAYSKAVTDSGFLVPEPVPATGGVPNPVEAALGRLGSEITKRQKTLVPDKQELELLVTKVREEYQRIPILPTTGEPNGWAEDRAAEHLVVTYHEKKSNDGLPAITVNGRAPAPKGVAGMGSHTTAWLLEVAAADALASVPDKVLENFQAAVAEDLFKPVACLDIFLPEAQLAGGQLPLLYDTALRVMTASNVKNAATDYLKFRNLLPYATVDAGDRGGHGEDLTKPPFTLFDAASLRQAAELQLETLADDERRMEVAVALDDLAKTLENKPSSGWGNNNTVRQAVAACVTRLRDQATALTRQAPKDVDSIIVATRWIEHQQVYKLTRSSRMVTNALADASGTTST